MEKQLSSTYNLLIPVYVRFWLYLIPNILSILCSIFVLYHLVFDRTLRQCLNNHIIVILVLNSLIYELTSVPLMLYYYRFDNNWIYSIKFAHFWTFIDYICYTTQLVGFAWASIERHILVFHYEYVSTKKRRFFVHYLPIIIVLNYCFIYYLILILFPFCEDSLVSSPFNGVPISCILFNPTILTYDTISHQIVPTLIIIILSFALCIRVLCFKRRLCRSIQWRKQRKMTIQLLSISILYLLFMGPRTLLQFLVFIGITTYGIMISYFHSGFFANYIMFFFPFVCCGSMSEIGKRLKKLFFYRKRRQRIVPEHLLMNHRNV